MFPIEKFPVKELRAAVRAARLGIMCLSAWGKTEIVTIVNSIEGARSKVFWEIMKARTKRNKR